MTTSRFKLKTADWRKSFGMDVWEAMEIKEIGNASLVLRSAKWRSASFRTAASDTSVAARAASTCSSMVLDN